MIDIFQWVRGWSCKLATSHGKVTTRDVSMTPTVYIRSRHELLNLCRHDPSSFEYPIQAGNGEIEEKAKEISTYKGKILFESELSNGGECDEECDRVAQ